MTNSHTLCMIFLIHSRCVKYSFHLHQVGHRKKIEYYGPKGKGMVSSNCYSLGQGIYFLIFRLEASWMKEMSHPILVLECKYVSHAQKWC